MRSLILLLLLLFFTSAALHAQPSPSTASLIRGDCNLDGTADVGDVILSLAILFSQGAPSACEDACDVNDDGVLDIADPIHELAYLFSNGPSPLAPFPACGFDPTSDSLSCLESPACAPQSLVFSWPMPGLDTVDWVINNYVDLDPGSGILDYLGGAKSYDGHNGIDIDVPTFRSMDNGFPILAAAGGTVVDLEDSHFDRNTSCTGPWNFVTIEHANGVRSIYGHLKQNSVVVSIGQQVQTGDVLGVVGSSGCSTQPHLHFEVRDPSNTVIAPFLDAMWDSPPVYDTPLGFMDAVLVDQTISSTQIIKDPPPNLSVISPGQTLGIGISMAGGEPGDVIEFVVRNPSNAIYHQCNVSMSDVYRHSYWWCNVNLSNSVPEGNWRVQILTNGTLAREYPIYVGPTFTGFQQVRHGYPASGLQSLFDAMVANGYRLIWIDGYESGGSTFYNVIFQQNSSGWAWTAHWGLTATQYQTVFNTATGAGQRPTHIESYRSGGQVRYAGVFTDTPTNPGWVAYHGVSLSAHNTQFANLSAQGYHPVCLALAQQAGTSLYTALWTDEPVGAWFATFGDSSTAYQGTFNTQTGLGRQLHFLNGYTDSGGTGRYISVFTESGPSAWAATHQQTGSGFQIAYDQWTQQGLSTRIVTAHEDAGVSRFAGMWSN